MEAGVFLVVAVLSWGVNVDKGTVSAVDLCHPRCECLDTFFYCWKQGLREFPRDFPTWAVKINISGNDINTIAGEDLYKLTSLQILSADGNNLTDFPRPPGDMDKLTHLSLARNALSFLDREALARFTVLVELDVSRNQISQISTLSNSSFPMSKSVLRTINLGHNQIETLVDGCLHDFINLVELILTRNRIKSLPKDLFSKSAKLEKLDLSRNKLEILDSLRFQELNNLQVLNLRRNSIRNLSDAAFYGLDKLQHLYLDGNRISAYVERRWLYGLRSLQTLNLSGNLIDKIEDNSWDGMEELRWLDLSHNKLSWLRKASFSGIHGLHYLYLQNNKLSTFGPETFISLRNLENLDLSENLLSWPIEDTPAPFKGIVDCRTLNLAGNLFQTLHSEMLKGLSSLEILNISSNPIRWLQPETFIKFPSIAIHLHNVSTLICDCHATWLHSRLGKFQHIPSISSRAISSTKHGRNRHRDTDHAINSPKQSDLKNSPQCAYPPSIQDKFLTDLPLQNLTCSETSSRPKFLRQPATQTFLKGGNGTLVCLSESHSSATTTINWLKDHHPLPLNLATTAVENFERVEPNGFQQINSSLSFNNVSWSGTAGSYQCVVKNMFGVTYSTKANITVHIFPEFVKRPSNVTVRLASNAKLECAAKGYPVPEIAFQKDGGENFPAALDRRFHVIPSDDSFMILDVQLIDMGIYCCSAKNSAGEIKECAMVTVYETPSFSSSMKDERVVEGSSTVLECIANGSPRPQIAWSKDNVIIHSGDDNSRIRLKEAGSLLVIKDVRYLDHGKYECILSNAVGTARDFLVLTVIPSSGSEMVHWSSPVMIIAFAIVVICCLVTAVFVFVFVMFRKRERVPVVRPPEITISNTNRFGDADDRSTIEHPFLQQLARITFPDSRDHSFSGKDSGTGDDIPLEADSVGHYPEQESLMGQSLRGDYFSTFYGHPKHHYPSNSNGSLGGGSVVSSRGRGSLSLLRKVAIPIPPPVLITCDVDIPMAVANISTSENGTCPSACSGGQRQSDEDNSSLTTSVNSAGVNATPTSNKEVLQHDEDKFVAVKPVEIEPRVSKSVTTAV